MWIPNLRLNLFIDHLRDSPKIVSRAEISIERLASHLSILLPTFPPNIAKASLSMNVMHEAFSKQLVGLSFPSEQQRNLIPGIM